MPGQTDAIIQELETLFGRIQAAITVEVTNELFRRTPVDIGWARANWVPSISAPDLTPRSNRADLQDVSAAFGAQAAAIGRVSAAVPKVGQTSYVVNSVPYIGLLEGGSSRQAPAGFVTRSIEVGIKTAAKSFKT